MIEHDGLSIRWLGYATLRIDSGDFTIYTDPGRYGVLDSYEGGDGDLVCLTHNHHYDSEGIRTVAGSDARLVAFEGINTHLIDRPVERPASLPYPVRWVDAPTDIAVGDAIVRTTVAYNDPEGPRVRPTGEPYHPEGFGCGFHLTLDGTSVYWPGDTDVLPGHDRLDVDVFCPPIGGSFTMDRHEAADLAESLDPDLVVPIHYDTFEAIETDAEAFAADVRERGVSVVLDD